MEQAEFLLQSRLSGFRHYMQQMFEHGLEPARHLHAAAAVMANFRDGQADKIRPVRRPVVQTRSAVGIASLAGIQSAYTDVHQEPVDLIQRQHGGRRIVDGR